MSSRSHDRLVCLALALVICHFACRSGGERATLSPTVSDEAFWRLSTELSESPGMFAHSDNLVSNEALFVHTVRLLQPRDGVYVGVGPEQNFSYIARLEPEMAFIVDIRQENRNLHLMYKALFESTIDRADFLARLFSRERPAPLEASASVQQLFAAFATAKPSRDLYDATTRMLRERLLDTHRFPLSPHDLEWIDYSLKAFYSDGPDIHYARSSAGAEPAPTFRSLMTAADLRGRPRSFLAREEAFGVVKDLHARNLIVPVVGDFGGPGVLKRVGDYIRQQGSVISAFYSSNVEVYLTKQQMAVFCHGLETLPYDSRTWFIRSKDLRPFKSKLLTCPGGG
jgi:hypothetical protein